MGRKLRFIGLIILMASSLSAQWRINLFVNPHPPRRISEWRKTSGIVSLTVTYQGPGTKTAFLRAEIRGARAGQILTGQSNPITFPSGVPVPIDNPRMVDWDNVDFSERFREILARTGSLPADNYEICVSVFERESSRPSAQQCASFEIISPSPPHLLTPENMDTVSLRNLTFRWTPVRTYPPTVPRYRIRVWRVYPRDNIKMALRRPPVIDDVVSSTMYMLPLRRRSLQVGARYIWAVQAIDEAGNPIGQNNGMSETWVFVVGGRTVTPRLPHTLKIGHFIVSVSSFDAGSRISSLSGSGRSFFYDESTGSRVGFDVDFTGLVGGTQHGDTLIITRGMATSNMSSPIQITVAGFKLHISSVTLTPDSATAQLYMTHPCLYDTGSPDPWQLGPFQTVIDTDGAFIQRIDGSNLEPFRMADLDIYFRPTGDILIDMAARALSSGSSSTGGDTTGSSSGSSGSSGGGSGGGSLTPFPGRVINPGTVPHISPGNLTPPGPTGPIINGIPGLEVWRGIIFYGGHTIERPEMRYSNTGYLYGEYSFSMAVLTDSGLTVTLEELANPWDFTTVSPYGFRFSLNDGRLEIQHCNVKSGHISGVVKMPYGENGVQDENGDTLAAEFDSLSVDSTLTFAGSAHLSSRYISWGQFKLFHKRDVNLRFTGEPRQYYLLAKGDSFTLYPHLDTLVGMILRVRHYDSLFIYTPDLPNPMDIKHSALTGWLVLDEQGLTGRIWVEEKGGSYFAGEFGRPGKPGYKSDSTFNLRFNVNQRDSMDFYIEFAGNSTFDARFDGIVNEIPYPTAIGFQFRHMNITSTAEFIGGKIHFEQPETLAYWGVAMDCKTGYLSIRSGEAIFTNANISETVHFSSPFNIIWSEIAADGNLKRMDFNQNSAYQKFDGFAITLDSAGLSQYRPHDKLGALVVRSYIHFDFFGQSDTLVTVYDYKDTTHTAKPYYGRNVRIDSPAVFGLRRRWGNGLADFNLDSVTYDVAKQYGFLGAGQFSIQYLDRSLYMAGDLKSDGTRLCIADSAHVTTVDMGATAVTAIRDIWGCSFIKGDELKRIVIGGSITSSAVSTVIVSAGATGRLTLAISPTVSKLIIEGRYEFKSIVNGVEMDAYSRLVYNRGEHYLEGDIYGMFNLGGGLPIGSAHTMVYGRFTFHMGVDYTSVQGEGSIDFNWSQLELSLSLTSGGALGVKGGFFVGVNVPKNKAWILTHRNGRFGVNMANLPATLTGFYTYTDIKTDFDIGLFGGGAEVFLGMGAMTNGVGSASACGGLPLPYVIGDLGIYLYGEILWGLVSASGTFEGQFIGPCPFAIEGTIRLEGCVAWVLCAEVGLTVGVSSQRGFYIE